LKNIYPWGVDHITFITEDSRRGIWIGTFENGVIRFDPASKKITHFSSEKDSVGKFADSTTWWAYKSRDGVMWMSTWGGGLYRFDPSHQNIPHTPLNSSLISFLEEPNNTRWIGTDSGLLRIDAKNNGTQLFVHDDKKQGSISSDTILSLYKDRENRLWAGTAVGLNLFNPDKQNFTSYKHDRKISSSLSDDVVFCVYEDDESNLWLGTMKGLDKMNVAKGEFTHYMAVPEDTIAGGRNFVIDILEDGKHNLWIADYGFGGLHQFNSKTGQFKHYLTNNNMTGIYQDHGGKLWAGSDQGLYKYDAMTDSFHIFIDPRHRINDRHTCNHRRQ
jgi:ligand-binding sensor domain-containing protein